jgi:hypothetical protein
MRAVALVVLVVLEILVGNALAVAGSPYPLPYLAAHVILAILLVGLSAHAVVIAQGRGGGLARGSAILALLGSVGAGISGTLFLYAGQSDLALTAMEALGGLALLGGILLLATGGLRPVSSPTDAPVTGAH